MGMGIFKVLDIKLKKILKEMEVSINLLIKRILLKLMYKVKLTYGKEFDITLDWQIIKIILIDPHYVGCS